MRTFNAAVNLVVLTAMLLITGCNHPSTRRVSVAYPEHWPIGEFPEL